MATLDVLFAPDWRAGSPYQVLLAKALRDHEVTASFLDGYKRVFPLRRSLARRRCDLLHLHWPEAYFPCKHDGLDWFRRARFPFDLSGATKRYPLALTAHNFCVHNRAKEAFLERNIRHVHLQADVIFAHSELAKLRLMQSFELPLERIRVIPHGDLSVSLGEPHPANNARSELGLGLGKIAVVFGTVEPYKGLEEIIEWWRYERPNVKLAIIGKPITPDYGSQILRRIGNTTNIIHRLNWLSDELLRLWLSAADVVIFNYREIFTSGAANLARSFGIPIVLPKRLDTIVLEEPTPYVRRFTSFETDFGEQLTAALLVQPDFAAASSWRKACSWDNIARVTADGYRYALSE